MNQRVGRGLTLVRAVVHEVRVERITFMAGSVAYHAFVSLLPLLLLVLAVVSAVGQQGVERGIIDLARATLTPGAADALVDELRSASTGVSVLGVAVLVWGTLRIFRGLDTAFSAIYETEAQNTLVDQFRDGVIVFGCVAAAIVVAAALERSLTLAGAPGWVFGRVALVVGLAVALLPMYYVFPDEPDMKVREALPGVVFAAVGLTAFESAFRLYVAVGTEASSGDVLAGVLVFMTWLYFSGFVLLVGAAVNAVLSNRSRDVSVRPVFRHRRATLEESDATNADGAGGREGAGAAPPDGDGQVDREALVAAVRRLDADLPDSETVTVTVDGEAVDLHPPEDTTVDLDTSPLPFVSDAVRLELQWSPGDRY